MGEVIAFTPRPAAKLVSDEVIIHIAHFHTRSKVPQAVRWLIAHNVAFDLISGNDHWAFHIVANSEEVDPEFCAKFGLS